MIAIKKKKILIRRQIVLSCIELVAIEIVWHLINRTNLFEFLYILRDLMLDFERDK